MQNNYERLEETVRSIFHELEEQEIGLLLDKIYLRKKEWFNYIENILQSCCRKVVYQSFLLRLGNHQLDKNLTYKEIGNIIGKSNSMIPHYCSKALRILRHPSQVKILKKWFEEDNSEYENGDKNKNNTIVMNTEFHEKGMITVDRSIEAGNYKVDHFGLKLKGDKVWICINGQSLIRFRKIDFFYLENLKEIK